MPICEVVPQFDHVLVEHTPDAKNYIYTFTQDDFSVACIQDFEIKEDYQRRSYGTQIINTLLTKYKYIMISNRGFAITWWKRFGHVHCDTQIGRKVISLL